MIQGSGTAVREQYREQAEYLVEHGIGALIYDKRGSGESTGDPDYRYAELAGDARAAIALLRRRPEVDPDAIGVWGFGEGGSVAALVAAGNPQVSAVVAVSPAAVAPAAQQEWAVRNALRDGGAGSGVAPVTRYYAVASDLGDAGLGGDRAADFRFDAARSWRRVSQPVLAVFGGDDDLVPVRASAASLRRALADGGVNRDRTFRTFAGASHSLGVESESYRPGSAPGLNELSASWLRTRLTGDSAGPVVSTPLPPPARHAVPVSDVQSASLLERWPVQLAWLLLPGLALLYFVLRRRASVDARDWWWLGGVVLVDALALVALAYAVASIVDVDGRGVAAVAGVPVAIVVTWLLTLAGVAGTVMLARRRRGAWMTAPSVAWLALLAYWLV
jgi:dienelactone hydrolase